MLRLFMITVGIRGNCNYECVYCVARNQIEKASVHSNERLADLLVRLPKPLVVEFECGGAEPTIHSQIRDLLEVSVQHGIASIPTNNSIAPERWLPRNLPQNMHVRAALHPEGEDDLAGFLRRLLQARALGAQVEVGYVAHPTRTSKASEYARYFASHQIPFHVRPFMGIHDGKRYPASHTSEERQPMSLYHRVYSAINNRDFFGIPCVAGHRTMYMNPQGQFQRCLYDTEVLSAPLSEPAPCRVHNCCAGLLLEELNMVDMFEEGHLLYQMAGLHPPSPPLPNTDAAFQGCYATYESLMSKSGKFVGEIPKNVNHSFSVRLFDADALELAQVLERNFYGAKPGVLSVANAELQFCPTGSSDHVATPFFDFAPPSRLGYSWLRLCFKFPGRITPAKGLVALLQDKSFVTLSENLTLASIPSQTDGLLIHFTQIHSDVGQLRMVFQTEGHEAACLPSHVSIDHLYG